MWIGGQGDRPDRDRAGRKKNARSPARVFFPSHACPLPAASSFHFLRRAGGRVDSVAAVSPLSPPLFFFFVFLLSGTKRSRRPAAADTPTSPGRPISTDGPTRKTNSHANDAAAAATSSITRSYRRLYCDSSLSLALFLPFPPKSKEHRTIIMPPPTESGEESGKGVRNGNRKHKRN